MKILFEICHPAHVHYFRNLINELHKNGHETMILAQNRGIISDLLKSYGLAHDLFTNLPKNIIGKLFYIPFIDFYFLKKTRVFKSDILIGFAGAYISHIGWLLKKPAIVFDDTEHASISHFSYKYFASVILTPNCFNKWFGQKHIKFNSYMELCYLHPNYSKNLEIIDLHRNAKKIILIRFVSWRANHDIGQSGFSDEFKNKMVELLSKDYDILISFEEQLPPSLEKYRYHYPPDKMHSILASVDLFIGEGATMASECACLGTPAIYVNSLEVGYCTEEEKKYNLIFNFRDSEGVLEKAIELLSTPNLKVEWQNRRQKMLNEKINVTAFMLWFVENYPESAEVMKKNPDCQYNFK